MVAKKVEPWWERVNDFYLFEERENFMRGATGYMPNNKQEAIMANLVAGYVNSKHSIPESLGSKREKQK